MIPPERLRQFFALVKDVRDMQLLYRRTLDSRLRVELPLLEAQLDRDRERLADDLGTGDPSTLALFDLVEDVARISLTFALRDGVLIGCVTTLDERQIVRLVTRARELLDPLAAAAAKAEKAEKGGAA